MFASIHPPSEVLIRNSSSDDNDGQQDHSRGTTTITPGLTECYSMLSSPPQSPRPLSPQDDEDDNDDYYLANSPGDDYDSLQGGGRREARRFFRADTAKNDNDIPPPQPFLSLVPFDEQLIVEKQQQQQQWEEKKTDDNNDQQQQQHNHHHNNWILSSVPTDERQSLSSRAVRVEDDDDDDMPLDERLESVQQQQRQTPVSRQRKHVLLLLDEHSSSDGEDDEGLLASPRQTESQPFLHKQQKYLDSMLTRSSPETANTALTLPCMDTPSPNNNNNNNNNDDTTTTTPNSTQIHQDILNGLLTTDSGFPDEQSSDFRNEQSLVVDDSGFAEPQEEQSLDDSWGAANRTAIFDSIITTTTTTTKAPNERESIFVEMVQQGASLEETERTALEMSLGVVVRNNESNETIPSTKAPPPSPQGDGPVVSAAAPVVDEQQEPRAMWLGEMPRVESVTKKERKTHAVLSQDPVVAPKEIFWNSDSALNHSSLVVDDDDEPEEDSDSMAPQTVPAISTPVVPVVTPDKEGYNIRQVFPPQYGGDSISGKSSFSLENSDDHDHHERHDDMRMGLASATIQSSPTDERWWGTERIGQISLSDRAYDERVDPPCSPPSSAPPSPQRSFHQYVQEDDDDDLCRVSPGSADPAGDTDGVSDSELILSLESMVHDIEVMTRERTESGSVTKTGPNSRDPEPVVGGLPLLVSPLTNDIGIPRGDVLISLLHVSDEDKTWARRVNEAIWRCRSMRRNCDMEWIRGNVRGNRGRTSMKVNADDGRVIHDCCVEEMQIAALQHMKCDEISDARDLYEDILERYRSIMAERNTKVASSAQDYGPYMSVAHFNLATVLMLEGDFESALNHLKQAASTCVKDRTPDGIDKATILTRIGVCLFALDDLFLAKKVLSEAVGLPVPRKASLSERRQRAELMNNLACLAFYSGEPKEASSLLGKALQNQREVSNDSLYVGSKYACQSSALHMSIVNGNLGLLSLISRELGNARHFLEAAFQNQAILLRDAHVTLLATMEHLAALHLAGKRKDKALQLLKRAFHMQLDASGPLDRRCRARQRKIQLVENCSDEQLPTIFKHFPGLSVVIGKKKGVLSRALNPIRKLTVNKALN